jgi:predicted DNA-binding transcriptional regulator AlpA
MAKKTDSAKKDKPKPAIPFALQHFSSLPDEALIPDKVVAGVLGCSVPSVWRMSKDGRIPPPVHPSVRMARWVVGGIRKSLSAA